MKLRCRLLFSRLQASGMLIPLRLMGLTLAALLAAVVPSFVNSSMEQVLAKHITANPEALSLVVAWASSDLEDHSPAAHAFDQYLRHDFLKANGKPVSVVRLDATGQRTVQRIEENNTPSPAKRYFRLGLLPDGAARQLSLVTGRLPVEGQPEALLLDTSISRSGYRPGDRLRVPLTSTSGGRATEVTITGVVVVPEESALTGLTGALNGTLLVGQTFFASLEVPVEEISWAVTLPADGVLPTTVSGIVQELRELPLRGNRLLNNVDVASTPLTWLEGFLGQMTSTERLLFVLLLPIYLLVVAFALATADMVVGSRRLEVAVQRSRGLKPAEVIKFYLGESLLLAAVAAVLGVLLVEPTVRFLGLSAGFLQFVSRPALPVTLTARTILYAAAAAAVVELISMAPLIGASRLTVATLSRASRSRSSVVTTLRVVAELSLLAVIGYGTYRMMGRQSSGDPLHLAMPALFLVGAGIVVWRLLELTVTLVDRIFGRWMGPTAYLALSLMRKRPARYETLWLMLVVTAGLALYGATLARTLDHDLVSVTQYRLGSDLRLRTLWESEEIAADGTGESVQLIYHEPPYTQFQDLPGTEGTARVQNRTGVALSTGNRSLGKINLMGIQPQEFGRVARFIPGLPASPKTSLDALALDESGVLVSEPLAQRLGVRLGDKLEVAQKGASADLSVVGIISQWPGQLPDDGEFMVGNLEYLQDELGLAPYDIWIRLGTQADTKQIVATLKERQALVVDITDRRVETAQGRREPLRLGMYGMLSAGFLVALLIMALSYLLNVGLVLQARAKELGVLRAMGMSARHVAQTLYIEQLLLLAAATATGFVAGAWAAALYVPILRQQPGQIVLPIPPSRAVPESLYILAGAAVALGAGVLMVSLWIKRLAIGKALRLGEDG